MNRLARMILGSMVAVPVALLSGCYRVSQYSGDGHLIDKGVLAATDRYVLNLGLIDLTQRGTKTFRIANLPEMNFVVGVKISVAPEDRAIIEKQLVNPTVSLELSGPGGKVLFTKKSPLAAWTWSIPVDGQQTFVYGRGDAGTYFNAFPKTEYTLTLNVLEPDRSQSKYTALLVAKSGGWK
jgi:hypothetical protein